MFVRAKCVRPVEQLRKANIFQIFLSSFSLFFPAVTVLPEEVVLWSWNFAHKYCAVRDNLLTLGRSNYSIKICLGWKCSNFWNIFSWLLAACPGLDRTVPHPEGLGDFYKWTVGVLVCHTFQALWVEETSETMKQVKMIKMLIMKLRSVSGSRENLNQF